jgi:SAM-dependent methyltransferase
MALHGTEETCTVAEIDDMIRLGSSDLATDLIQEYADFRGSSYESADAVIKTKPLNLNPGSSTDSFYEQSDDFLISLIRAQNGLRHLTGRVAFVVKTLAGQTGLDVLDAGGGLGNYCIALNRCGNRCTYADIPGVIMDFARKRFASRSLQVDICDVRTLPDKKFHALLSFDVLEHLVDPVGAMTDYALHLQEHGLLFMTVDFMNFAETFHLRKNFPYSLFYESILATLGFQLAYNGGLGPVESVIKAGIRVYAMERPVTNTTATAVAARATAKENLKEYRSYFDEELRRMDRR